MERGIVAHGNAAALGRARHVALAALLGAALAPLAAAAADPIALPAPASFAAAVAAIEGATGVKGEPLEIGTAGAQESRSFALDGSTASRLLAGSHATFRKAGLYLFRYERGFGLPGEKDHVALLATTDRNVVIRRVGTAAPKLGLTPDRLVAWLDALAKEEPFELFEIGVDYLAGRFVSPPKDPAAVARRSAEIAPDLVAGRATTLALLAEEIHTNRTLYLIW